MKITIDINDNDVSRVEDFLELIKEGPQYSIFEDVTNVLCYNPLIENFALSILRAIEERKSSKSEDD